MRWLLLLIPAVVCGAAVEADLAGVRPGPFEVRREAETLEARWPDEAGRTWVARFSLDPARPLVESIGPAGQPVIEQARPYYRVDAGIRRRGWDEFFDYPPSHPEGTRSFLGAFELKAAQAASAGDRLELRFDGLEMGLFRGSLVYSIYAGSRLIRQEAAVTTSQPDVAYLYDAGIEIDGSADSRPGNNMETRVTYYDTRDQLRTETNFGLGPERIPLYVRYRTAAVNTARGSLAVFPAPHQYFPPRDFTSNLGFLWQRAWRGRVGLGIRQLPDTNWRFYPWINGPPETAQRLAMFLLLSTGEPTGALNEVLRFTNRDRFPALSGYKTMSTHWHFAYTVQALEHGFDWVPPFKPVLKGMGVDASVVMDFHGDGNPRDLGDLRLEELAAFYRACQAQSDREFLLIPGEEANVHLGGHWAVIFPQRVLWWMDRKAGSDFVGHHPRFGRVYATGNAEELLEMVRREGGYMYQTHPRTKGSRGYPDQIRDTEHFRDPRYWGAGWKAMPADLSLPRLGNRGFTLLDDLSNWGYRKRLLGEVDVFQVDQTHELYAHMNINYVRIPSLPAFFEYGKLLEAVDRGDFFVSTGEVLLPEVSLRKAPAGEIEAVATVEWRFPLELAEVVWGDGSGTHVERIPLPGTRPFGRQEFRWKVPAKDATWARLAVWDVAGNGAFVNPAWFGSSENSERADGARPAAQRR